MAGESDRNHPLYSGGAFGTLILSCFAQYLFVNRIYGEPWQVVVSFVLGAAYTALGILGDPCSKSPRLRVRHAYFFVQCLLLTALVWVTPVRGFFAIIVMPVVGEAVFHLSWRGATVVGCYLFTLVVGALAIAFGPHAIVEGAISYIAAFAFTVVFTLVTSRAVRAREEAERLRAELESVNAQLRAHAAEAEELATTRERNRLAREIHDGVGHYLTVIKVQLDAATALLPIDPPKAAESVNKAARLAGEALDDVRRSVGTLAADTARPPLTESLRALVAEAAPLATLQLEGAPRALSASAEHALHRTAQEGLTNVRKHAAADRVVLTLDFRDPQRVRLTLHDNGRGATNPAPSARGGYGLRGLRERIALLGGKLEAGNAPEGGFLLCAEVPA